MTARQSLTAAQQLARLLRPAGQAPVEHHGATAIFQAIAGEGPLVAEVSVRPAWEIHDGERALLSAREGRDVHLREGALRCAAGWPVALVTALVVTARVPCRARHALGISPSGQLLPARDPGQAQCRTPLGRALHGLGVRREQLSVTATPGRHDQPGEATALRSVARLWSPDGYPLALVTERVTARFLDTYPPPWPLAPATQLA
jgi:hypothetical protein